MSTSSTVSAGLMLAARAAAAQDTPGGPADATPRQPGTRLERIEIRARPQTDTGLRRRAPVAKRIDGREQLDQYGDTNLSDVLKRLPGVTIQSASRSAAAQRRTRARRPWRARSTSS